MFFGSSPIGRTCVQTINFISKDVDPTAKGILVCLLGKPVTTFHSVRTPRFTRVTDLNSVNQSTHTFCCGGFQIFTNEICVTSLSSEIAEHCAHGRPIGLDPKNLGVVSNLRMDSLLHSGWFHAEIVELEIGGVAIYRPFGEFRRANSYCHLYGVQGQRLAYSYPLAAMNPVVLDLTTSDRCH
ncbi:hypothetical protein TNCV_195311 [Trichonephila clavipes]|uniref:Uncharacterized protein n=1 Tax=Trichonephila clavipes TaxID=2585209 RepID=A0A8X6WI20_TRICX|nr:hypothetical protein TNCV_195311 [Trichonephila clavipes]